MKELSIKEKAERYDEAIKVAKGNYETIVQMDNDCTFAKEGIVNTFHHIFPELKESEDERMVKFIKKQLFNIKKTITENYELDAKLTKGIDWLEKQGEHANFRNKIQIGDKVTRNEDGVLVNLSQLKRMAKPAENKGKHNMGISEATKKKLEDNLNKALEKETPESCNEFLKKQGEQRLYASETMNEKRDFDSGFTKMMENEQKPADKVEPKFKVGDFIVNDYCMGKVIELTNDAYLLDTGQGIPFSYEHNAHLWTIEDAKEGDVLVTYDGTIVIYQSRCTIDTINVYCCIDNNTFVCGNIGVFDVKGIHPATKEQRDTLMKAITDAGYTFDFEKKELKKIEQKLVEEYSFNIESELFHQLTQAQQGLWRKEIEQAYNVGADTQKPAWSEEDDIRLNATVSFLERYKGIDYENTGVCISWLKSLRHQSQWKPSEEQMDALHYVTNFDYGGHKATLVSLYEQLKKLRKE